MSLFSELNLEIYQNNKLTLPNAPLEYIQLTFVNQKCELNFNCVLPFGRSELFQSPIVEPKVLVDADDVKKVYEFKLNVPASTPVEFFAGDTIGILPENRDEDVQFMIERLGIEEDCDRVFELSMLPQSGKKKTVLPNFIPKVYTIRKVFKECVDFNSVPKKLFLRALAKYTANEDEKCILNVLASAEGKLEYEKYFFTLKINIIKLLKSLESCKPPVTLLFEHLTRLMPRPYSIASCPLKNPTTITIVFSKLDSSKPLTTTHLERVIQTKNKSAQIRFYFRMNLNKFQYRPEHLDQNIIMISFGTAISPFIGFLEHRATLLENTASDSTVWLLTGNRYYARDNLYYEQLNGFLKGNILTKLLQAFSRDPMAQYKYVQDIIVGNCSELIELFLNDNTTLYICGNGTLFPIIENVIVKCMQEELKIDEESARALVKDKKKNLKYIEDIWL